MIPISQTSVPIGGIITAELI